MHILYLGLPLQVFVSTWHDPRVIVIVVRNINVRERKEMALYGGLSATGRSRTTL
jgi:hypothetical protein